MSSPTPPRESRLPNEREVLEGLGVVWPIPPFIVVRESAAGPGTVREGGAGGPTRPDGIVTLSWNGTGFRFAVEYKAPGTPKQLDAAIAQLRRYLGASSGLRPLIVAPYLKPELLDRLVSEGVSAVDLCGNMAIVVPNSWLVVQKGNPNRFPSSAPIKNVYRGRSSLVARELLTRQSVPTVTALANDLRDSVGLTMPTISKVLRALEDEVIITRGDAIRVVQPDRLLANLLANYRPPTVRRRVRGKVGRDDSVLAQLRANADRSGLLYAADLPERYTILPSSDPVLRIYTTSIEQLVDGMSVDELSRFPDVEFLETDDPGVYFQRVEQGSTYCTSRLEVYLALASGGKREQQAAQPIRNDLLRAYA